MRIHFPKDKKKKNETGRFHGHSYKMLTLITTWKYCSASIKTRQKNKPIDIYSITGQKLVRIFHKEDKIVMVNTPTANWSSLEAKFPKKRNEGIHLPRQFQRHTSDIDMDMEERIGNTKNSFSVLKNTTAYCLLLAEQAVSMRNGLCGTMERRDEDNKRPPWTFINSYLQTFRSNDQTLVAA